MNVVAIMESFQKGRTIDTVVDRAIKEVQEADTGSHAEEITRVDRDILYGRHCGVRRNDDPAKPIARCAIQDDMQEILPVMRHADALIFGGPIFEGTVNALTKIFLECICWTLSRARPLACERLSRIPQRGTETHHHHSQ